MNAKEFSEWWSGQGYAESMVCYDIDLLKKHGVSGDSLVALSEYGLPEAASPYLNFECKELESLPLIAGEDYFYLGFDGEGNWICLNPKSGQIVILDHEVYGEGKSIMEDKGQEGVILLNSSLETLYIFMKEYSLFLDKDLDEDSDEYQAELGNLKANLLKIDNAAMADESYWGIEMEEM